MGADFEAYLERLEILGFFSGYPLLYALIIFIAGPVEKRTGFKKRLVSLLPFAYALTGTLFLGYLLKNWYPDYTLSTISSQTQQPLMLCWGLLSVLFWLPYLYKRPLVSLIHSLYFFVLFVSVFITSGKKDIHVVRNNMKVYADSLLILTSSFIVLLLIYYGYSSIRKQGTR